MSTRRLAVAGAALVILLPSLASATITFARRYHWYRESKGRSVAQLEDGGYVFSGENWIESSRFGAVVARADSLGDTIWVRHIVDIDQGSGYLCRLAGGGVAVAGTRDTLRVFCRKYDENGNPVWDYVSTHKGLVSAVISTQDGGCLIVGRLPDPLYDFGAIKLDADGHEQWMNCYDAPSVYESWAYGAAQTSDGGYVLCGAARDYLDSYPRLVRTDSAGGLVWHHLYPGPAGPQLTDVCETAEGVLVTAGWEIDTLRGKRSLLVMRTTESGQLIRRDLVWRPGASSQAAALCPTLDGGRAIAGTIDWGDSARVLVIKVLPDGDTSWTAVLGGPEREGATAIVQTGDSGYIILGTSAATGGSILLVKTDSIGRRMTGTGTDPHLGAGPAGLCVHPNPARGQTWIRYEPLRHGPDRVRLLDAAGRQTRGWSADAENLSGWLRLDLAGIPSGVYLLRLEQAGTGWNHKLVVK